MPGRGAAAGAAGALRFLTKDTFGTDHERQARCGTEKRQTRRLTGMRKLQGRKVRTRVSGCNNPGVLPARKGNRGGCDSRPELMFLFCFVLNRAECQWLWKVWLSFCMRILQHAGDGQGFRKNLL